MGLETTTYLSGLTPSWPLAGDLKSQGDDHIRLIKSALQATFPSATKPFYFPKSEIITTTTVLDATDQNNTIFVDSTAGDFNVTLPTLGASDGGFSFIMIKSSSDHNAAIVMPASGSIVTGTGAVASARIGILASAATFVWSGGVWFCSKPGPSVGSTENYDGSTIPFGYLDLAGGSYSSTAFAELFLALGTTTLRDKRGRVDIGSGTGTGLTARTLGTSLGAETVVLSESEMPAHDHGGLTGVMNGNQVHDHSVSGGTYGGTTPAGAGGSGTPVPGVTTLIDINPANIDHSHDIAINGGNAAHANMQPSIVTRKIIRAC